MLNSMCASQIALKEKDLTDLKKKQLKDLNEKDLTDLISLKTRALLDLKERKEKEGVIKQKEEELKELKKKDLTSLTNPREKELKELKELRDWRIASMVADLWVTGPGVPLQAERPWLVALHSFRLSKFVEEAEKAGVIHEKEKQLGELKEKQLGELRKLKEKDLQDLLDLKEKELKELREASARDLRILRDKLNLDLRNLPRGLNEAFPTVAEGLLPMMVMPNPLPPIHALGLVLSNQLEVPLWYELWRAQDPTVGVWTDDYASIPSVFTPLKRRLGD